MSNLRTDDADQYIPTDKKKQPTTITRIILVALILFVFLALIDWLYVNEHSERIRFITINSLSLLVVVIIAIQSVIYRREWRVMQHGLRQTDRMIDKMHEQLETIQKQAGFMEKQTEAALRQAEIMLRTLSETHQMVVQNERAVKAAEVSAEATERAVEIANKNMVYAQRAYVNIVGGRMLGADEDGFKIVIKNSGHTPANDVYVKYVVDVAYLPPEISKDPKWEAAGVLAPDGTYDIGAHANRTFTSDEQKRRQASDEGFRVWCVGIIYYKDIFQRNPLDQPHYTHFCIFGEWGNPLFRAWSDGNDAD